MTPRPSLPLAQQILGWLVPALGYRDAEFPVVGVSASTLKNARKGARIPYAWTELVASALKALHLGDGAMLASIGEALRQWDARVSTLSGGEELPLPDRLHMLFALAIPALGTRLGALAVMMARKSRSSLDEWLWILRPLDRRLFGRVLVALLRLRKPEWTTREAQLEGLAEIVDARTVERWMSGALRAAWGARGGLAGAPERAVPPLYTSDLAGTVAILPLDRATRRVHLRARGHDLSG